MKRHLVALLALLALLLAPAVASAAEGEVSSGDTAWVLVSTALVLFMTLPGLFLFYAGLVQRRNVLSVMMHCMVLVGVISVLWLAVGYSAAFSSSGMVKDQMGLYAFAIITPALMVGAFVERIKFSAMLWFCLGWSLLVCLPVCHRVWGGEGAHFGDLNSFLRAHIWSQGSLLESGEMPLNAEAYKAHLWSRYVTDSG